MSVKYLGKTLLATLSVAAVFAGSVTSASAVSERVKNACYNDYTRFCPAYAVGSSALRQCMRSAQNKLSNKCKSALRAAGEG
jgi:hypothetical protein